ncbi:MAG: zinc-ribbon domain-containing protein, partial [Rhodoferax sp.]|nr:zinc-ribbon domain-containing protein [Rhodoferax sp.]
MSLITRCPACETLFKVVPDQLRMSEGWVRCGQCSEIFDASLHLLQSETEPWMPPLQHGRSAAHAQELPSQEPMPAAAEKSQDLQVEAEPDELPVAVHLDAIGPANVVAEP